MAKPRPPGRRRWPGLDFDFRGVTNRKLCDVAPRSRAPVRLRARLLGAARVLSASIPLLRKSLAAVGDWSGRRYRWSHEPLAKLLLARPQSPRNREPLGGDAAGARCSRATVVVASAGARGRGMVGRRPGRPASPTRSGLRQIFGPGRSSIGCAMNPYHHPVACNKCDWKAAFDRDALIASHGPTIGWSTC